MQKIELNIYNKTTIVPILYAKQGEVGRKFKAIITDGTEGYTIPADAALSVWYSGASGDGNYSKIGDRSAFSVEGNTVTVELIAQMLNNKGQGKLCLYMATADGTQLGTWNIPYVVEGVPGMGSVAAKQYYPALSKVAYEAASAAVADANPGPAIVGEMFGEIISVTGVANAPLQGLTLYGKTTQDGTPTPDTSIDLVSVGNGGRIEVTITDGTDENIQSVTVSTPNGLPGIPVFANGNYTDSNGQQWLCDEIDFARGVYVQRVLKVEFDGSSDEGWEQINLEGEYSSVGGFQLACPENVPNIGLCNKYSVIAPNCVMRGDEGICVRLESNSSVITVCDYSQDGVSISEWRAALARKPIVCVCESVSAIEIALPSEMLDSYAALHTNKPNTTVYTDSNAGMKLEYVADSKTYVDKMHSEQETAIGDLAENVARLEKEASQKTETLSGFAGAILNTASGEVPAVNDASDYGLSSLILYGKTTQNGTPTPDVPVKIVSAGDSGSIGVTVAGKNLFDFQKGVASVSFYNTNGNLVTYDGYSLHMPAGTYTLNAELIGSGSHYIYGAVTDKNGNFKRSCNLVQGNYVYAPLTVTIEDGDIIYIYDGWANHGISNSNHSFAQYNIQIEAGSVATDYEPYKGQAFTVSTPNSLPGMPVSSNGNYTDSNGQQWVCDEIDLARGVHIKRVDRKAFNTTEGWSVSASGEKYMFYTQLANIHPEDCAIFCNIAQGVSFNDRASTLDNFCYLYDKGGMLFIVTNRATTLGEFAALLAATPLEVIFVADSPVETPLSDTDIEGFKELHGYKPYTTVYSDSNAGVKIEYVADTKTYIDNKFAELAAAIVANT